MPAAHRSTFFRLLLLIAGGFVSTARFAASADGPPREAEPSRTISLYGTVFGPENRPVAGASLYLSVDEWTDPIELGTSGDDGTYRFEVSEKKLRRIVAPSFMLLKKKASLIAVAVGAWA